MNFLKNSLIAIGAGARTETGAGTRVGAKVGLQDGAGSGKGEVLPRERF